MTPIMRPCGYCGAVIAVTTPSWNAKRYCRQCYTEARRIASREYKRHLRRAANVKVRALLHQAHVVRWEEEARRLAKLSLHEGHVLLWRASPHRRRRYENNRTDKITDGYVRKRLCKNLPQLSRSSIPQSLVEVERARLQLVRAIKKVTPREKQRHEQL